ncbi:hypothetical protein RYX36_019222 [Vicia faba]
MLKIVLQRKRRDAKNKSLKKMVAKEEKHKVVGEARVSNGSKKKFVEKLVAKKGRHKAVGEAMVSNGLKKKFVEKYMAKEGKHKVVWKFGEYFQPPPSSNNPKEDMIQFACRTMQKCYKERDKKFESLIKDGYLDELYNTNDSSSDVIWETKITKSNFLGKNGLICIYNTNYTSFFIIMYN